jgi:hypothetical protein
VEGWITVRQKTTKTWTAKHDLFSEIQAANLTLAYYETLRFKTTPKPRLIRTGCCVILNDSASDPYCARSSRGANENTPCFNRRVLKSLLFLFASRSGRWNLVVNGFRKGGCNLCWDDSDAENLLFLSKLSEREALEIGLQLTFWQSTLITATQ